MRSPNPENSLFNLIFNLNASRCSTDRSLISQFIIDAKLEIEKLLDTNLYFALAGTGDSNSDTAFYHLIIAIPQAIQHAPENLLSLVAFARSVIDRLSSEQLAHLFTIKTTLPCSRTAFYWLFDAIDRAQTEEYPIPTDQRASVNHLFFTVLAHLNPAHIQDKDMTEKIFAQHAIVISSLLDYLKTGYLNDADQLAIQIDPNKTMLGQFIDHKPNTDINRWKKTIPRTYCDSLFQKIALPKIQTTLIVELNKNGEAQTSPKANDAQEALRKKAALLSSSLLLVQRIDDASLLKEFCEAKKSIGKLDNDMEMLLLKLERIAIEAQKDPMNDVPLETIEQVANREHPDTGLFYIAHYRRMPGRTGLTADQYRLFSENVIAQHKANQTEALARSRDPEGSLAT
ncbi:MAG TPA: hypothetical protein VI844_01020 [Coxiellaceae bacterium]|nr:hypothetical protein [Coxiellaceae bacterium]